MVKRRKPVAERKTRSQPTQVQRAYIALLSTAGRVRTRFEMLCAPFDITGQQYNVLRILRGAEPDGLPTLMIADRLIERTPGITRMIDRLEGKGLVVREMRPNDRRYVQCRITEKGLSLLELLNEPVEQANRDAFQGLSKAELNQLIGLLEKTKNVDELD